MSKDPERFMKLIRQRKGPTGTVMDNIKNATVSELETLQLEEKMTAIRARVEENKKTIRESQKTGQPITQTQSTNYAALLFSGRSPEEVKQILTDLTPEHIQKLALMTSNMNAGQSNALMAMFAKPQTNVNDTVALIKTIVDMGRPQQTPGMTEEKNEDVKETAPQEETETEPPTPGSEDQKCPIIPDHLKPLVECCEQYDKGEIGGDEFFAKSLINTGKFMQSVRDRRKAETIE